MKVLFLDVICRAKKRFDFIVENFCIMGNHYHIVIKPAKNMSLSRIMQWIMSVFAMAYNRIHDLTGHVWGARFFSKIIESLKEYLHILDYIDQNPVRAGLVSKAHHWQFGGLFHRIKGLHTIIDPLPINKKENWQE